MKPRDEGLLCPYVRSVSMRLKNRIVVITGGSGGIGQVMSRRYLEEGATVILTGRNHQKLEKASADLIQSNNSFKERIHLIVMDGADPRSIAEGIPFIEKVGKVDVLINNAGSAGPMQLLANIPLSKEALVELQKQGFSDTETLKDAVGSLLGCPWFMTVALLPYLKRGASIINVSTIFSRTDYCGRIPYVVPKAALNRLSHFLAEELGKEPWSMRVNTLFPGPVESERIHRVLAVMDRLKGVEPGTTEKEILSEMLLKEKGNQGAYLSKEEIANVALFLGSAESSGVSNQDFEATHALSYADMDLSQVNLNGEFTWILAGDDIEEAHSTIQKHVRKGEQLLLTFRKKDLVEAAKKKTWATECHFVFFDPEEPEDWENIPKLFEAKSFYPTAIFVLPRNGARSMRERYGDSVVRLPFEKIQGFLIDEIMDPIVIARGLAKTFQASKEKPAIFFLGNEPAAKEKKFANIRKAAIHEMIRCWRYENQFKGIDMAVSDAIQQAVFAPNKKLLSDMQGRVAFVTGGSEGIGREVARILLEWGAKVVIASRSQDKLERARDSFIQELKDRGVQDPEKRIVTMVCDLIDENKVEVAFNQSIPQLGRIDFLVNNAGIPGQEQSLVDMSLEGWMQTMQANLISNYDLLKRSLPYMRKQKEGHIISVSSLLGGMENMTPSYPNRGDYAVTKAGQRGMATAFSSLLGPDILINTLAPGPVEGARLRGGHKAGIHAGLYQRRAKVNFENKRLNQIYNALIKISREGADVEALLDSMALNDIQRLAGGENVPAGIKKLMEEVSKSVFNEKSDSATHLLTRALATKLLDRLRKARKVSADYSDDRFFASFSEPQGHFISDAEIRRDKGLILQKTYEALVLKHMPSEYDIGREVVLNLADGCMTGETLYPTCGYTLDHVSAKGDFIGIFDPALYPSMLIKRVMIVGDSMYEEMAKIALAYQKGKSVEDIVVVVGSTKGKERVDALLQEYGPAEKVQTRLETLGSLDRVFDACGLPQVLISMPLAPLQDSSSGIELPDLSVFKGIIENQITNHFQIAQRGSLIDNCKVIFITHALPKNADPIAIAFAKFIQIALAPLCVTAAQEAARLAHQAVFYQLDCDLSSNRDSYQKRLIDALMILSLLKNESPTNPTKEKFPLHTGTILSI